MRAGIRLMARMIGMIGVIILIAREIILMIRMIAQICKNTRENKENTPKGAAEGRACVFFTSPCVFVYLGYHPSHWDDFLGR